jgi:hypothetical protein
MLPERFGFDKRRPHLSCLVNAGNITRQQALEEISRPAIAPAQLEEDRAFVIKKLGIDEQEFAAIMAAPRRTFWDFPSYERDQGRDPWLRLVNLLALGPRTLAAMPFHLAYRAIRSPRKAIARLREVGRRPRAG